MEQVIVWTVAFGSGLFVVGLISALSSRKRLRSKSPIVKVYTEPSESTSIRKARPSAADMASRGVANTEENLASVGSNSR